MSKYILSILLLLSFLLLSAFELPDSSLYNIIHVSRSADDSLQMDRKKFIDQINSGLKGNEKRMVDSVFSNLKVLGGFPAENLVFAMESWSKALGVSCGHCHNTNDFSSDEMTKKIIAREMVNTGKMINDKLKSIQGLSKRPMVNCTTCHRGSLKPALRLAEN